MSSITQPPAVGSSAGFDRAAFDALLESRDEPRWLSDIRQDAFSAYQEKLGEPLDPEEWKRVELRMFRPEQFSVRPKAETAKSFATLLRDRTQFAGHVAHVDGWPTASTLDPTLSSRGVLFGDLATLVREHGDVIKPHLLAHAVKSGFDRFSAWHAAFMTGGTVLYVPAGVEIEQPLHSLIGLSQANAADFSHTLVILEAGATATLLEETVSIDEEAAGLHVGAVELLLAEGSRLSYVQLQNWNKNTWHFGHQAGSVGRQAALQWTVAGIGSKLAHVHQHVSLDGEGAEAEVNGVTFAVDRQRISYYTQQSHNAPHTRSDLLYKEVLRDRSRVVWRGMIRVEPAAQKTDGYQRSDALLLSPDCRNDAIPGLEIEADDVRCTHGATAGRVDDEQIFYAMCRGMTKFEAMHMIVEGFFRSVYDRIPVEVVRETLGRTVANKLGLGG